MSTLCLEVSRNVKEQARDAARQKVGSTCRGWKIRDEDVTITEVYSPGQVHGDKRAEIIYHARDGCVFGHEESEGMQCHAPRILDAAGNPEIIKVAKSNAFSNLVAC